MPEKPLAEGQVYKNEGGDWLKRLKSSDVARFWLSAIIESAEDAIISKTLEGIITSWNRGAERIFGYSAAEVIGKPITILIPADHENEEPAILARLRSGERIEHYETIRVHKNGRLIDISLTVSPIRDDNGNLIGASKIARDITEQKRIRRALDAAAARLNLALEAARLGDWSWNAATDIVTFSDTAAAIFDVAAGPHMTWTEMRELLHEEDRERARLAVEQSLVDRSDYDIEYRVIRNDRSACWVSAKGRGEYDPQGTVLGMIGVVQDITEQKALEQTMREQTEALRTINEMGNVISAELDLHKMVQAVTNATTDLTGAEFGAFFYNGVQEGGGMQLLFTATGLSSAALGYLGNLEAKELFNQFIQYGVIRADDTEQDNRYELSPFFPVPDEQLSISSYLAVPVISRSGEVLGGIFLGHRKTSAFTKQHEQIVAGIAAQSAIAMDNARLYESARRAHAEAERVALEKERLYRQAQESSRLKDEFLATISHELRTPLNAILGWAHLVRSGQLDNSSSAKAIDTIERNARAQAQLIDDLLDVSRIITGKLRLDVRPADPNSFIEAAVEALRPAAEAKGVRVQRIIDTGVVTIPGDPVRLQQVVWNMLSNAIKFTPRGGRVQVRLERVNSHIDIVVSDTGQGIPADFLPHVFDRFRQADQRTTRQHGGMGLGLAIVRHLVELHGGTVTAASQGAGKGSTFTVSLPVTPVYQLDETGSRVHPTAQGFSSPPENAERLDGLKILVVDDEKDTRELLSAGLTQCGAEVSVAGSAGEAFKVLSEEQPDVLISDIGMPGEDGYDVIRRLRSLPAEEGGRIPAIALTAYARVEDRMHALKAGYQMHVPKPVELAELAAVIASVAKRESS